MGGSKKGKYAAELARLKALNAVKEVLNKSDIENAALTNTSKDSETVSDNALNNKLDELNLDKNSAKDLEIIESLSAGGSRNSTFFERHARTASKASKRSRPKKIMRAVKRAKPKGKPARKKR